MDDKITTFIQDLEVYSATQAQIVRKVRSIYQQTEPSIEERFIYGGIGFFLNEKLIGGVYGNKKHVSIVFSRGNELSDPEKLLEGGGKYRRHLKGFELDDVDAKNASFFIEQVVRLEG